MLNLEQIERELEEANAQEWLEDRYGDQATWAIDHGPALIAEVKRLRKDRETWVRSLTERARGLADYAEAALDKVRAHGGDDELDS